MRFLISLLLILAGCASEPEKIEFPEKSCLETYGLFMAQRSEDYKSGPIDVGHDYLFTWVTNTKTDMDEYLFLTAKLGDHSRYGAPIGRCQNTDTILKIYMFKEKTQR